MFSAPTVRAPGPGVRTAEPEGFGGTDVFVVIIPRNGHSRIQGSGACVFFQPRALSCFANQEQPRERQRRPQGWTARSLNDFSPLDFSNSAAEGEIGFRSLIDGAGVLKLAEGP